MVKSHLQKAFDSMAEKNARLISEQVTKAAQQAAQEKKLGGPAQPGMK